MARRPALLAALVLVGATLLAACGETDETGSPVDGSIPLEATDDSVSEQIETTVTTEATPSTDVPAPDGSTTTVAGGGPQASEQLCEALVESPNLDQVELFPEELQDDAQEYVEAIQDFEDRGADTELPEMTAELAAFVSTCQ
jgi:crotonobetainyl-CoA:carnitine CoA-transferase CaiB-like acyl-CoA transferase